MGGHSYKSVKLRLLADICGAVSQAAGKHPGAVADIVSRASSVFAQWAEREEAASVEEREASRIENENIAARYAAEKKR